MQGRGLLIQARELALNAMRGQVGERKPTIGVGAEFDVRIHCSLEAELDGAHIELIDVENPFQRAQSTGLDLNAALKSDLSGVALDEQASLVRERIEAGLAAGFDGVFYRLHGANMELCSPMFYGGQYLECDRELLEAAGGATMNVVFAVGGEGTFLDCLSDLPCNVFAWDNEATQVTDAELRTMRIGATGTLDADSDFRFDGARVLRGLMENELCGRV